MSDVTFRTATPATPTPPSEAPQEPEPNTQGESIGDPDIEPVEDGYQATLNALGIGDDYSDLPNEEQEDVRLAREYVENLIEKKGLRPTESAYRKAIDQLKEQMGLDPEAEPSIVLDRIGGVVRAWRDLSFVDNPQDKRKLFMRLARMGSAEEMNREVFKLMNERRVWQ